MLSVPSPPMTIRPSSPSLRKLVTTVSEISRSMVFPPCARLGYENGLAAFVVPRIVPPRWRMPETLAAFMGRVCEWTKPSKHSSIPRTSHPNPTDVFTAARITAFNPGQSPPPVRTPTRIDPLLSGQAVTSLTAVCHPWHAPNHPWGAKTLHLVFIELLALPVGDCS